MKDNQIHITDMNGDYFFDSKGLAIHERFSTDEKPIYQLDWEDVEGVYTVFYEINDEDSTVLPLILIQTKNPIPELGSQYFNQMGYLKITLDQSEKDGSVVNEVIDLFEQTSGGREKREKNSNHPYAFFHVPPCYYSVVKEHYQPTKTVPRLPIVSHYRDTQFADLMTALSCAGAIAFVFLLGSMLFQWGSLDGFEKLLLIAIISALGSHILVFYLNPLREKFDFDAVSIYSYLTRRTKKSFTYQQISNVEYRLAIHDRTNTLTMSEDDYHLKIYLNNGQTVTFKEKYYEEQTGRPVSSIELAWILEYLSR